MRGGIICLDRTLWFWYVVDMGDMGGLMIRVCVLCAMLSAVQLQLRRSDFSRVFNGV
jgi:hypothetical protein